MDRLPLALTSVWDFAAAHPIVSAWLALTTAWTVFTVARRDA